MLKDSRIDIYDYLYGLFYQVVSNNVYRMTPPQELTESDVADGFIVIGLGDINDASEFSKQAYGWSRAFVEVYVPPKSRGRLDKVKYKTLEDALNTAIDNEIATPTNDTYGIESDSVVSMDGDGGLANNSFNVFIKSFVVFIDKKES